VKSAFLFAAIVAASTPAPATAAPVETRIEQSEYGKMLIHEVAVAAPREAVWKLISTSEGWKAWAVPTAWIDMRIGGIAETSYDPAAKPGDKFNIQTRILAIIPGRLIAFKAVKAPEGFPYADLLEKVSSVFELEEIDATHTRIRLTGSGYGDASKDTKMMAFFEEGNRWSLDHLVQAAEQGPVDWNAVLKDQN